MLKPVRKFRRWMRRTPTGEIARTLVVVGISVVFVAGAVAFYLR